MKPFYLTQVITSDKLIHQGIYFSPPKRSKYAILWVHGLMSNFYGHAKFWEILAATCEKQGIGFAAFNNRGHDIVVGIKKVDKRKNSGTSYRLQGAACEKFEDCMYDIEAGVKFLLSQKFSKIILVGHSTGANKVCYYAAKKPHRNVVGVVLASPVSDRLTPLVNPKKIKKSLIIMDKLVKKGKGDELITGHQFHPITPKRFISLYRPLGHEDIFDYGEKKPKLHYYSKIKIPMLVVFGENDEFIDRKINDIKAIFNEHENSSSYESVIIPKAFHGFKPCEKIFSKLLINWIKSKL